MKSIRSSVTVLAVLLTAAATAEVAQADGGVTFRDIVRDGSSGISYSRAFTPERKAIVVARRAYTFPRSEGFDFAALPDGTPGVVVFDYDNDGDQDVYVTNGPGADNSLFQNQLKQTGQLKFVDVGARAGVGARDMDSVGACSADTDNDGDLDLLVVGINESHRFFLNQGNGTFVDRSGESGFSGARKHAVTCSFGDFNNDGLVDAVVANTWNDWNHQRQGVSPYAYNENDQTFVNLDGRHFAETSATSGIETLALMPPGLEHAGTVTWSTSMVDIDQDGDVDIVQGDDQNVPNPFAFQGGNDIGIIRIFINDGTGHFTDISATDGLNGPGAIGAYMGLSYGDFNCDGNMDVFGSNGGDYYVQLFGMPAGIAPSAWYLNNGDGTFSKPGVGRLVGTPFGWGTSTFDYDNDGDQDIIFHGGLDTGLLIDADNPGSLLQNLGNCTADFDRDAPAILASGTDHKRRTEFGVATGDLNDDGFPDILSAATSVIPASAIRFQYRPLGGPFDPEAARTRTFQAIPGTDTMVWQGVIVLPGDLSIEVNSGDNGNKWAVLQLVGTIGLVNNQTSKGAVNRSAAGAVVKFTPEGLKTIIHPVLAGASYGSQDSLNFNVGLGSASKGTVEILWPGGVRNKLYDVQAGERLLIPEIPCSFTTSQNAVEYRKCVRESLKDLRHPSVNLITEQQFKRFEDSALRAYQEAHGS
jgi:enediyne biosynthesis protein E4